MARDMELATTCRVWGRHSPTRFRARQNDYNASWFCCYSHFAVINNRPLVLADNTPRAYARFAPAAESCSIKSAFPPASFPFTPNTAERLKFFDPTRFSHLTLSHRNQKAASLFDRLAASNRLIACQYILDCRFTQQPPSYKQISPDRPYFRLRLQNSYSAATRLWSRGICS